MRAGYVKNSSISTQSGEMDNYDLFSQSYVRQMLLNAYPNQPVNSVVPFGRASQFNYLGYGTTEIVSLFGWLKITNKFVPATPIESAKIAIVNDKGEIVELLYDGDAAVTTEFNYFGLIQNIILTTENSHIAWSFVGWKINQNQSIPTGIPTVGGFDLIVEKNGLSDGILNSTLAQIVGHPLVSIIANHCKLQYGQDVGYVTFYLPTLAGSGLFINQYLEVYSGLSSGATVVAGGLGQWFVSLKADTLLSSNQTCNYVSILPNIAVYVNSLTVGSWVATLVDQVGKPPNIEFVTNHVCYDTALTDSETWFVIQLPDIFGGALEDNYTFVDTNGIAVVAMGVLALGVWTISINYSQVPSGQGFHYTELIINEIVP